MAGNLEYEVSFKFNNLEKQLKNLETEMAKAVGKGVAIGTDNAGKNVDKRGRLIGAKLGKSIKDGAESQMGGISFNKTGDKVSNQARSSGKRAGNLFGKGFAAASGAIILGQLSSFLQNNVFSVLGNGISLAGGAKKSDQQLVGAISVANKTRLKNQQILRNSASSYEERASALGLDVDKLYEEVDASNSAEDATKGLEKSIRDSERALEDSIRTKEQNIDTLENELKAVKKVTEEKIKGIRAERGYNKFEDEIEKIDIQIENLRLQENELDNIGANTQAIKLQIEELQRQRETAEIRISQIDRETDAIKEQGDVLENDILTKIETIRDQITAERNKFDIDIEPAKRKLEDLRDLASSVSSGGETKKVISDQAKKAIDSLTEQNNKQEEVLYNPESVQKAIDTLKEKYGKDGAKVLSEADIKSGVGDILLSGSINPNDLEKEIVDIFSNAASAAYTTKSPGLTLSDKVSNILRGFKTGQSQAGELSGIKENYQESGGIIDIGKNIYTQRLTQEGKIEDVNRINQGLSTQSEQDQFKKLGFLQVSEDTKPVLGTVEGIKKEIDSGAIATEQFNFQWQETQRILGESILPEFNNILKVLGDLLDKVQKFVKENPEVTKFLIILTTVVGVLVTIGTIILSIISFVTSLVALFGGGGAAAGAAGGGLAVIIGGLTIPLGWVIVIVLAIIGIVFLLITHWETIVGWVTNFVNWIVQAADWVGKVADAVETALFFAFKFVVDNVIKFFSDLFSYIIKFFVEILPEKIREGIEFVKKVFDAIVDFFTKTDWGNLLQNLVDAFKNALKFPLLWFLDRLKDAFPGVGGVVDDAKNQLNKFASGGSFNVPQGYRNDTYPIYVQSGEKVTVTPSSQNNTNNNYYGLTPYREFIDPMYL